MLVVLGVRRAQTGAREGGNPRYEATEGERREKHAKTNYGKS